MKLTIDELRAFLRADLYLFIEFCYRELYPEAEFFPNWHLELIAQELTECMLGNTRRLIINVPPRSLKSICASVAFVAWLLGRDPTAQILCASYAQSLADKHALDTRTIMMGKPYQEIFPTTQISPVKFAINDFLTSKGGFRLSTSVGGTLTGKGADFIIIDDPLKPDEALSDTQRKAANDWYAHTVLTRLNDKRTGCVIVIMQRLHEDDLAGYLMKSGNWKVLRLPAIAEEEEVHEIKLLNGKVKTVFRHVGEALHPEREPLSILAELREALGEYNFAGQYQQCPAPLSGGLVQKDWFKTYDPDAPMPEFEFVFQSWDTANKPGDDCDFSVCTTWGCREKRYYLLHVLRKRLGFPDLKRLIVSHAALYGAKNVLIEDKASGTSLIQALIDERFHQVTRYTPKMDKAVRLQVVTPFIENGFVYLPGKAPWLGEYIHEMVIFNKGKYDDQVDSTSQALDWVSGKNRLQYGLLEWAKRQETDTGVDPAYAAMFTRPRGPAR